MEFSKNPPPGEPKIYLAVVLTDLGLLLEDKGDYDAARHIWSKCSKSGKKNWEANMRRRPFRWGMSPWCFGTAAITRRRGPSSRKPWPFNESFCRRKIRKLPSRSRIWEICSPRWGIKNLHARTLKRL